jgi:hypothetical protein
VASASQLTSLLLQPSSNAPIPDTDPYHQTEHGPEIPIIPQHQNCDRRNAERGEEHSDPFSRGRKSLNLELISGWNPSHHITRSALTPTGDRYQPYLEPVDVSGRNFKWTGCSWWLGGRPGWYPGWNTKYEEPYQTVQTGGAFRGGSRGLYSA